MNNINKTRVLLHKRKINFSIENCFTQKFKMATKNGRKMNFGKNFGRNHSISHSYRDKCVFVFYAGIQDCGQKWWENDFWLKLPVDCRYPVGQKFCRNCSISHHYRNKWVLGRNSRWPTKMAGKNATVFKLQVILLIMEVTEKSKSSYYSLSYWDKLLSYHVIATEKVAE